jgi:uncharacterized lipoprotein YddW (UPF0748 family)
MKRLVFVLLLLTTILFSSQPKYEFRAAWIATVYNIDWPSSTNVNTQKNQLIAILEKMEAANMNAAILQIRPACDALYASDIEPWSNWLTGTEGKAPNPYYDPLEFAINEAHKRNIELHAWFNPYRAKKGSKNGVNSKHPYVKHLDWILGVEGDGKSGLREYGYNGLDDLGLGKSTLAVDYILNPGLQEVREYVLSVIMDVVNRYDIDGVHMDDYFYPYSGIQNEDKSTFNEYNRGFSNIHDWRRDNINLLLEAIGDSINVVKPHVKFGMSPFGIWKNGVPSGIVGLDTYSTIYCDGIAWLRGQYIDYITPQLYWPFGGGQDYKKLMRWWAEKANNNDRHLYTGNAPYRINSDNWSKTELPKQIRYNRNTEGCYGNVYFSVKDVLANPKGLLDSLKNNYYQYPALTPIMEWKDSKTPCPPKNLTYEVIDNSYTISWDRACMAWDGDTTYKFILYKDDVYPVDVNDPSNILKIIEGNLTSTTVSSLEDGYFALTAVDRMSNESDPVSAGSVGIENNDDYTGTFNLLQNYPNPFNPTTKIEFILSKTTIVTLTIYNLLGEIVKQPINKTMMESGHNSIDFNASDLNSGIYFYRLQSENNIQTKRMVLLK